MGDNIDENKNWFSANKTFTRDIVLMSKKLDFFNNPTMDEILFTQCLETAISSY